MKIGGNEVVTPRTRESALKSRPWFVGRAASLRICGTSWKKSKDGNDARHRRTKADRSSRATVERERKKGRGREGEDNG